MIDQNRYESCIPDKSLIMWILSPKLKGKFPELVTLGPFSIPGACHGRRKIHLGQNCHSPHYDGPYLSIRPYLGKNAIKLSHPCIHLHVSIRPSII